MMTRNERFVCSYNQCNTLNFYSCSDESEEDIDPPKMKESVKKRVQHHQMIDQFISRFSKEKHSLKDFKLMQGVFSRKELPDDFHDDGLESSETIENQRRNPLGANMNNWG